MNSRNYRSLENFRQDAGLTQVELAKQTGLAQGHLSKIEAGERTLQCENASDLASPLDVDARTLFSEHTLFMLEEHVQEGSGQTQYRSETIDHLLKEVARSWLRWPDNEYLNPTDPESGFSTVLSKIQSAESLPLEGRSP